VENTLAAGVVLSRYRIIDRIGAGGMGEVYKAHDSSLDRFVALKILPPELVSREDRLQRFVQEAKTASALSHPNIITIHEIGQAEVDNGAGPETVHFIAMELVDGETLRKKIHRERRSLRSLLDYLAQSADGLAKAHVAGVVHRDLKPDNIMVTEDGFAKILDFGLAKLLEGRATIPGSADEATELREKTAEGVILGTLGYMSPEQVEGKPVDARSDVFSFGCILYEAVTRKKPFDGESGVDVLHKILHQEPEPLADLAPDAPWELRRIVRRCLAKEPDRRYQSMRDLANELRDLVDDFDQLSPGSGSRALSGASAAIPHRSPRPLMWAAVGVAVLAFALLAGFLLQQNFRPQVPQRNITIRPLTSSGNVAGGVISPDGRYLAYGAIHQGQRALYLRQIATGSEVPVIPPSTTLRVAGVTFSRDGNYLYVTRRELGQGVNWLTVVPTLGGSARQLIEDVDSAIALSPDQTEAAFVRALPDRQEIHLVIAKLDGSNERVIATRSGSEFFETACAPSWSPDGRWIATCAGSSAQGMRTTIMLYAADGTESRDLIQRPWFQTTAVAWLPDGTGLVATGMETETLNNQIWLFPFPSGEPRRITSDLTGYANVSLSGDGNSLVAVAADNWNSLWKVDSNGATLLTNEGDRNLPRGFALLGDGSIAYQGMASGNLDVWRMMPGGEKRQLTSHARADYAPATAPGGERIYFLTERNGAAEIWRMTAEGTGQQRLGTVGSDVDLLISPDERTIVYSLYGFSLTGAIFRMPSSGGEPETIAEIQAGSLDFSPDGRMLGGMFRLAPAPAPMELAVLPLAGGTPRGVGSDLRIPFRSPIRWTPDGQGIAFPREDAGASNLWIQPIDGGEPVRLTSFDSGSILDFRWDRSGQNLFVSRGRTVADIVEITDFRD
jgi:eukaryotic-like serine/threonine-protein kinase